MSIRNRRQDEILLAYSGPFLATILDEPLRNTEEFAHADYSGARHLVEVKGRYCLSTKYDSYFLSRRKWNALRREAMLADRVPIFAWAFFDDLRWVDMFDLEWKAEQAGGIPWELGGRTDRGAAHDLEMMWPVPRDATRGLPTWKYERPILAEWLPPHRPQ